MSAALKIDSIMRPEDVIQTVITGTHAHICQSHGHMFKQEMAAANLLGRNRDAFFTSTSTSILWPKEIGKKKEADGLFFDRKFNSSREKMTVLDEMKKELTQFTKSSTLIDEIAAIADEFVTNALFNAPFIDPVTHVNKRIDRMTTTIDLPMEKGGRLFLAEDGHRILIGVEDPFGSLDAQGFLKRIHECYVSGTPINFGAGGAGIGCFIIFQIGVSMFVGVKPGQQTTIAAIVPHKMSRRQRDQLPKNLHWIKT